MIKWNQLDEMGQEFSYYNDLGVSAWVWREIMPDGQVRRS